MLIQSLSIERSAYRAGRHSEQLTWIREITVNVFFGCSSPDSVVFTYHRGPIPYYRRENKSSVPHINILESQFRRSIRGQGLPRDFQAHSHFVSVFFSVFFSPERSLMDRLTAQRRLLFAPLSRNEELLFHRCSRRLATAIIQRHTCINFEFVKGTTAFRAHGGRW